MMSEVRRQRAQLRELATTDHTTLLLNRMGFEAAALVEPRRAVRYDRPIAVLFLDIDDFKVINTAAATPPVTRSSGMSPE